MGLLVVLVVSLTNWSCDSPLSRTPDHFQDWTLRDPSNDSVRPDDCVADAPVARCPCDPLGPRCIESVCASSGGWLGYRCAEPCSKLEDCLPLETCINLSTMDSQYFCWSVRDRLCLPCAHPLECFAGDRARCVPLPDAGTRPVCLISCEADANCPDGYHCPETSALSERLCLPLTESCPNHSHQPPP
jgi:hypothetical protein